jgi:TRAP-type C4-dicarboxylate transport system permease small subunit
MRTADVQVWGNADAATASGNRSSGVPMRDKATGRAVAVIVLLVVAGASLRGYIPEHGRTSRQASSSPLSMVFVIALLTVTLAILAIALVTRLWEPRKPASTAGVLPEALGGGGGRPSWRVVLFGLAVLVVWLVIVWALTRLFAGHGTVQLGPQPPPASTSTPKPPVSSNVPSVPQHDTSGGELLGYLAAATLTFFVLLAAATVVSFRRQRRILAPSVAAEKPHKPAPKSSESLARAAELGLAEIGDLTREPREAIIACYAAMEGELAHVPGAAPQAFDTPTEVLARAVDHQALHADNAAQLVRLFAEARFSPHEMNESHREAAVHALELVLTQLRSAA